MKKLPRPDLLPSPGFQTLAEVYKHTGCYELK